MKKIYKLLAVAFTFALIVTSPMATITSHAQGLNIDSPEHDGDSTMPDNYWDCLKDSEPAPSYSEPAPSYSEPATNSSEPATNSSEPATNSSEPATNSSEPATNSSEPVINYSGFNANSPEHDGNSTMPSNYWSTVNNANNVTVSVTGGQQFRNVMSADHTTYQVYHCGISKVTFAVTDAENNAVAYKTVKLEKGEDGLWYENITFADNVDVKGLTLNVTKGDATYLSTELGVSGIKINGTVVLSTVPAETDSAETVIGHRYCSCGASFDIRENSGIDKDAWSAHAREHAAKGESARYTDK